MASFLIVENALLATTYPDVCTAYMIYILVPVRVAIAERSFSKLKLIKNFLRSFMSQERLSGLALLSIENERAKNFGFRKVIQQFASAKEDKKFQVSNHPQVNYASLFNWPQRVVFYLFVSFDVMSVYCMLILLRLNNLFALHNTSPFC